MAEHATMTCDEFLDLAAAVALDAVDDTEAARVEEHAAECPRCATRLREFRQVAAALGSAVPQVEPPPTLRAQLVDALRREPRPLALAQPRRFWRRGAGRPQISVAWLVAAASLVVSLGAVSRAALLQSQITSLQQDAVIARERAARYERVVGVLASDKLAIRQLRPAVQNMPYRGLVYLDPSSGTGMVMCHDLPPLEKGRAYQVWFVRGSERVSGGLLWTDNSGNGYSIIQVPNDLHSFDSLGVTDEPGTGSALPTTPRVIGTPLRED